MSRACIKSALPTKKCWLALVGEAPGRAEEQAGQPFVGAAGKALRKACHEVAIHFSHVLLTNVFLERPEKNEIVRFFARPSSGHRRNIRVITSLGKGPHGYLAANQGDEISASDQRNQKVSSQTDHGAGRHRDLGANRRSRGGKKTRPFFSLPIAGIGRVSGVLLVSPVLLAS